MTKFQLEPLTILIFCFISFNSIGQEIRVIDGVVYTEEITDCGHLLSDNENYYTCDDPEAINNISFEQCEYPKTKKSFKKVTKLDSEVNETSGLIYDKGFIWTHNDSGGEAALYKIDPKTGNIIQKVTIPNGKNIDWEDLAHDENHIYIGDFGNNYGYRKDLKIYKIAKSDINKNTTEATAEVILFSYPEQTTFEKDKNHNFDCEAFFAYAGELHLFTKNWNDSKTSHYIVPTETGEHKAKLIETFDAQGLITAADIDSNGVIVLIGYTPQKLFMWICSNHENGKFFSGSNRRIEMGRFAFRGQLEGICFSENGEGYISGEKFKILNQHLRYFSLKKWLYLRKPV